MWWDLDGPGSWAVLVIATACWLTTVALIVWAIMRVAGNRDRDNRGGDDPVEIARRRLARGEITKTQFDDLEKALR